MTKEKGLKYGIVGGNEACKTVKGEEVLPLVKPPVIREELPELPTIPSGFEILQKHLEEMNAVLQRVFEELRLIRTGEIPTLGGVPGEGMYYVTEEVAIQVATPNPPTGQVIDSDRIAFDTLTNTFGPAPNGYQRERIHDVIKRNAPRATVINDGDVTIYVITSPNGRKWSPATPILPYEARTFFNVWELRLRCPVKGDLTTTPFHGGIYRVTEYDYWLSYSRLVTVAGAAVTVNVNTLNRPNFIAQRIAVDVIDSTLPNITVPDGFALSIIANVNNVGQIFLSRTDATVVIDRTTLAAGDVRSLFITNANLVHVAGSVAGQFVDIIVELT